MSELKPCPFCGGEATIEEIPGNPDSNDAYCWTAGCKECNIGWYEETKTKAIEKWNRRAEPENNPLTLEELLEMDENTDVEIVPLKPRLWHAYKEGISTNCFETYRYEDYGKTWFAYRQKPVSK